MTNRDGQGFYGRIIHKRVLFLLFMLIILILAMFYSITLGVAKISFTDVYGVIGQKIFGIGSKEYSSFVSGVILKLRLPRVILAVLTGLALGSTGAIMQSILKNPLASPYTLGVSSGAAFGAGLAIVLGGVLLGSRIVQYSSWVTIIGAFIMGVLTILVINALASLKGGGASILILAGVALGYLFQAGISFIKYVANLEQLHDLTLWLMGGLYLAEWTDILILTPIIMIGLLILLRLAWDINALNAGEEVATNMGIDVQKIRRKGTVIASFITSCVVSFTGIIGFIGLVAPHICRMIIGNDSRFLILTSGLFGGFILLCADTIARIIINPAELPVGIITSLLGAPFFLYMLIKKRGSYWS